MSFDTWNESAESAVSTIYALVRPRAKVSVETIRTSLDDFIASLFDRPSGNATAVAYFSNIGADAAELAGKLGFDLNKEGVTKILIKKQRDYGPENIARFGRKGLLVRLHDKVARLENLSARGTSPENEAVVDTYLDIIGYCAIGIMWETNQFLLPLK